jgi:hypothetical protein
MQQGARLRVARREREHPLELLPGALGPAGGEGGARQQEPRLERGGREAHRLLELPQGGLVLPGQREREAQVAAGLRVGGIELHGPREVRKRRLQPSRRREGGAQVGAGGRALLQGERALVGGHGGGGLAPAAQVVGEVEVGARVPGPGREARLPEHALALVVARAGPRPRREAEGQGQHQDRGQGAARRLACARARERRGARREAPDAEERQEARERQVHPALGPHLAHDRDQARARRQQDQDPGAREAQARSHRRQGQARAGRGREEPARGPGRRHPAGEQGPVVEDEGAGGEGEAEVARHDLELRLEVGGIQQGHRLAARARELEGQQDRPAGGERRVERSPPPQRPGERAREEGAVVEQDQKRRRGRDRLAAHAERAGRDREAAEEDRRAPLGHPDRTVEREQHQAAGQRLGALHGVEHDLAVQGMHRPEETRRERQARRGRAQPLREERRGEGAAQDPEQEQRGGPVEERVCDPEGVRIGTGERPGERQAQIGDRSAGDGLSLPGRRERNREGPEGADRRIPEDPLLVVEDEGAGESSGVGERHGQGQEQRAQQRRPRGQSPARGGRIGHHAGRIGGALPAGSKGGAPAGILRETSRRIRRPWQGSSPARA